jgi:hypothetical protein
MSVFRVQLNNAGQGQLDIDPTTSIAFTTSEQRKVYVMGPKKINRLLSDGDTFTDSNYWKRFAYPQVPLDQAFIQTVTDDGSVYSDVESENTFGVSGSYTLATSYNSTNVLDFVTTHGGPATFVQIRNMDASIVITAELNGDTSLTLSIPAATAQVFNAGDLSITKIRLKSASGTPSAQIIASVKSAQNS